jgi:iron complex outermembrane recepter protein
MHLEIAGGAGIVARCPVRRTAAALLVAVCAGAGAAHAATPSIEDLRRLTIEELANVQVSSLFKRPEPLSRTPASAYVITSEEIHRSGARTLPEALRLAPNLMVARRNSGEYAISARGFNFFQLSNKLLVLIDGRSLYTPLHAGVLWDQQQVMVEDIERIEVISGPAGTLWGANAVNGVINVITRDAHDTQGGLAVADYGTLDQRGAVRYGGRIGGTGAWRAYGLGFEMGETLASDGEGRGDEWRSRQGGFRADWEAAGINSFTVQGDIFDNTGEGGPDITGGNFLARWGRRLGEDSSFVLQAYYDTANRDVPGVREELETFDVDGRHNFRIGDRHEVVWGAGFRHARELFENDLPPFVIVPTEDTVQVGNLFVQDSMAVTDDLTLTLGSKVEYSSYTGVDFMPSARLAWQISEAHMLWGAVSRAVRTPSRIDRELEAPGILQAAEDEFGAEELYAYEIGYRGQPNRDTALSVSLYYHDYDDLRVLTTSPGGLLMFGNAQQGYTMGIEAWGDHRVNDRWRLAAGVNLFRKSLELKPGATTVAIQQHQGNDPEYQLSFRSYYDLTDDIELDVGVRHVDALPFPEIPGYTAVDVRLAWHPTDRIEISVAGRNLLDSQHPETGETGERGEIPRSVYVGARWRF